MVFIRRLAKEFVSSIDFKPLLALAYDPDLRYKLEENFQKEQEKQKVLGLKTSPKEDQSKEKDAPQGAASVAPQAESASAIDEATPVPLVFPAVAANAASILAFLESDPVLELFPEGDERTDYHARIRTARAAEIQAIWGRPITSFSDYVTRGAGTQQEFLNALAGRLNELSAKHPPQLLKLFLSSFLPSPQIWETPDEGLNCAGGAISVIQNTFAAVTSSGYVFPKILSQIDGSIARISSDVTEAYEKHVPALFELLLCSKREEGENLAVGPLDTANRVKLFVELASLKDRFTLEIEQDLIKLWNRVAGLIKAEPEVISDQFLLGYLDKQHATEATRNQYPDLIDFIGLERAKLAVHQTIYDTSGTIKPFSKEVAYELCTNLAEEVLQKLAQVYTVKQARLEVRAAGTAAAAAETDHEFALIPLMPDLKSRLGIAIHHSASAAAGSPDSAAVADFSVATSDIETRRKEIETHHKEGLIYFRKPENAAGMVAYLLKKYLSQDLSEVVEEKSSEEVMSFIYYLYSTVEIIGDKHASAGHSYYDLAQALWHSIEHHDDQAAALSAAVSGTAVRTIDFAQIKKRIQTDYIPNITRALERAAKDLVLPSEEYNSKLHQLVTSGSEPADSDPTPHLINAAVRRLKAIIPPIGPSGAEEGGIANDQIRFDQVLRMLKEQDKPAFLAMIAQEDRSWLLSYFVQEATVERAGHSDDTKKDAVDAAKAIMEHSPDLAFEDIEEEEDGEEEEIEGSLSLFDKTILYSDNDPSPESPAHKLIESMLEIWRTQMPRQAGQTGQPSSDIKHFIDLFSEQTSLFHHAARSGKTFTLLAIFNAVTKGLSAIERRKAVKDILDATKDGNGATLLHIAAVNGWVELVRGLALAGAKVGAVDGNRQTPLELAAQKGHTAVVRAILALTVNKIATRINKTRALLKAAENGHAEAVTVLLMAGANPNVVSLSSDLGLTALQSAALRGNTAVVAAILAHAGNNAATQANKDEALFEAVTNGHQAAITTLLEAGADPNSPNPNGLTPLQIAVQKNHSEMVVEMLARQGLNSVNTANKDQALFYAVQGGRAGIARSLITHGANTRLANQAGFTLVGREAGFTLLHLAIEKSDTNMVRVLIEGGAEVNTVSTNVINPLQYAAQIGNLDVIEALLALANADSKDQLLRHAVFKGCHVNVVKAILAHIDDNAATQDNKNRALLIAAENGRAAATIALLEARADPNYLLTPASLAALQRAVLAGHAEVVTAILTSDAPSGISTTQANKNSALLYAVRKGRPDMARSLITHGANARLANKPGFTLLHIAVENRDADMIKVLIEGGADANVITAGADIITPLQLAARRGYADAITAILTPSINGTAATQLNEALAEAAANGRDEAVAVLLRNGANPNFSPPGRLTALQLAVQKGYAYVANTILTRSGIEVAQANKDQALFYAVQGGRAGIARSLITHGANARLANQAGFTLVGRPTGLTLLHLAIEKSDTNMVRVLIEGGADVNAFSPGIISPFQYAARIGKEEVIRAMLVSEMGISADNANKALFEAVTNGHQAAITTLLEAGADPNSPNPNGLNSLELAMHGHHLAVVRSILAYEGVNQITQTNKDKALHKAAEGDHADTVEVLVRFGANAEILKKYLFLHRAAKSAIPEMVEVLLRFGASVDALDKNGRNPLRALLYSKPELISETCAALLFKAGGFYELGSEELSYSKVVDREKSAGAENQWREIVAAYGGRLPKQEGEVTAITTQRAHDGLNLLHRSIVAAFECKDKKSLDHLIKDFLIRAIRKGCRASDEILEEPRLNENAFELIAKIATAKLQELQLRVTGPDAGSDFSGFEIEVKRINRTLEKITAAVTEAHDKYAAKDGPNSRGLISQLRVECGDGMGLEGIRLEVVRKLISFVEAFAKPGERPDPAIAASFAGRADEGRSITERVPPGSAIVR